MNFIKKLLFFLIPFLFSGILFSLLNFYYPENSIIWLSLLISVIFGLVIKIWQEIISVGISFKTELLKLRKEVRNNNTFLNENDEMYRFLSNEINTSLNKGKNLSVYRGYSHNFIKEKKYFIATIEALQKDKIQNYFRAMSVKSENDLRNILQIMLFISKKEKSRRKTTFYLCYENNFQYISFMTIGSEKCFSVYPDLEISEYKDEVEQHNFGVFMENHNMTRSYNAIFNHIISLPTNQKIEIPSIKEKSAWKELVLNIVKEYNKYQESKNLINKDIEDKLIELIQ